MLARLEFLSILLQICLGKLSVPESMWGKIYWSEKWFYPESQSLRLPAHTDIELPEPERVGHAPPPPQGGAETREEESDGEEVVEVARQADGQGRYVSQPQ